MRTLFLFTTLLMVFQGYSQQGKELLISGIVVDADSLPIPDVQVLNTRTMAVVRTNSKGFFQSQIMGNDSLLIFHVSFKRRYINENDNLKITILEYEINELQQVDVTDAYLQDLKNLQLTLEDIKRKVPLKKISKEDMKSIQTRFVEEQGSHNKGFSPYFGPKIKIPFWKIIKLAGLDSQTQQRKKLTSHYHFTRKKSLKKEE